MCPVTVEARCSVYCDLRRPGRYRVQLTAGAACDPYDLGAALEDLGYEPLDADQWGRSYRHRTAADRTAELDEIEGYPVCARLVLHHGEIDLADLRAVEEELAFIYGQLIERYLDEAEPENCESYLFGGPFPVPGRREYYRGN